MNLYLAHGEIIPGAQTKTKSHLWLKQAKGVLREYQARCEKLEHTVFGSTLW